MAGIIAVQHGTVSFAAGQLSNTASITSVNTTKSVVKQLGASGIGAGIGDLVAQLSLSNQTTVQAVRSSSSVAVTVAFTVKTYA